MFFIYATLYRISVLSFYSIIFMYIDFYYKLIFINKFIKHNQINEPYCNIKYLDLFCPLIFPIMFLFIVDGFF